MPKAPSVKWTREHSLIALNLYCKLPFGKFDKSNPVVKLVAEKMGRTANSLAMKLSNLASLDPIQRARGIKGLSGASSQDRAIWQEFHADIANLGIVSEQLLHDLFTSDDLREVDFLERGKVQLEKSPSLITPTGPTEATATIKIRRGQQFFRQSILNAYSIRCCITGINIPRLLIASHIKPWNAFPSDRLNPRNGLCLSTLHDAAFDAGLITLNEHFEVVISRQLTSFLPQASLDQNFSQYAGIKIQMPAKLAEPDAQFLAYHRDSIFQR